MGLKLKPGEVKNAIQTVYSSVHNTKESYTTAFGAIQSFSQNEAFQSKAWVKIKADVQGINQLIDQGMTLVKETINQELSSLDNSVGFEDLDEDLLMEQIQKLTQECQVYEETIRTLEGIRNNSVMGNNFATIAMIQKNKELLLQTKELLAIVKAKLEILREKENVTFSLFHSVGPLLQAIEFAINDAEVAITGTGIPSNGQWKKTISESINKVTQTNLENVLGISVEKYKELYGEKNLEEIQKYVDENKIYGFNPEENEKLLVKVIEQTTGCSVTVIETQEGEKRYQLQEGDSTVLREYTTVKIRENIEKNSWKVAEIIIPEEVSSVLDGEEQIKYPLVNWGLAGCGKYPEGVNLDDEGRYVIAVGPKIIIPDYPDDGKIREDDFQNYSNIVKVVLVEKETKEEKIIECVVTDYKAHSYNTYPDGQPYDTGNVASVDVENGLIQTGIAYPKCSNAKKDEACATEHMGGQIIEFCGHAVDFDISKYTLKSIIVIEE